MQGPERPGRHQQGQALVQGRTPLPAEQRSLHGYCRVGPDDEGAEGHGPGASGGSLARAGVEGAVRRRAGGDARPCAEGAEARESGEQVPTERAAQVRRVWQALLRPGRQERPVRLLHLRNAVQGRCRDVQRPLPERSQGGGLRGREHG